MLGRGERLRWKGTLELLLDDDVIPPVRVVRVARLARIFRMRLQAVLAMVGPVAMICRRGHRSACAKAEENMTRALAPRDHERQHGDDGEDALSGGGLHEAGSITAGRRARKRAPYRSICIAGAARRSFAEPRTGEEGRPADG